MSIPLLSFRIQNATGWTDVRDLPLLDELSLLRVGLDHWLPLRSAVRLAELAIYEPLGDVDFIHLVDCLPLSLRRLSLGECGLDAGLRLRLPEHLTRILCRAPRFSNGNAPEEIDAPGVEIVSLQNWPARLVPAFVCSPRLKTLDVSDSAMLTGFRSIIGLERLETIVLSGCDGFADWKRLVHLPKLRTIFYSRFSLPGLQAALQEVHGEQDREFELLPL